MPRPKEYKTRGKFTTEQLEIIETCAGYGLTIEEIARILKVVPSTIKHRMSDDETTKEAYQRGRAKAKQFVVSRLFDLIKQGEPSAIYFYLKCQCGWREKEKDVVETTASQVTIYLPEKDVTTEEPAPTTF